MSVTVAASPDPTHLRAVAQIVWQRLHERFDELKVTVHGDGRQTAKLVPWEPR